MNQNLSDLELIERSARGELEAFSQLVDRHQQNEDGSFGPRFLGDLYNQSLGTLALRLAQERGFNISSQSLVKAQSFLEGYRVSPGQWAYRKGLTPEKNLSAWANLAMDDQPRGDQPTFESNQSQSSTFLSVPLDPRRKSSLTPMDVFLKTNTRQVSPSLWKRELLTQQIHQGDLAGSWPVEGPWGHVGGRVFTTSIALLSMTGT